MINSLSRTKIQGIEDIDDLEDIESSSKKTIGNSKIKGVTKSYSVDNNSSLDYGNGIYTLYKNNEIALNDDCSHLYHRAPDITNKSHSKTEMEESRSTHLLQMVKYKLN
jgi:hypothetical protein